MYYTVRIDADPTSWELERAVPVPSPTAPAVLPAYHPLLGDLVLSHRSVGSVVFLEYRTPLDVHMTRPNGYPISEPAIYLPSPAGLAVHITPPNLYTLASGIDLTILQADIISAMINGNFLTVNVIGGEVVMNGAEVPFAVLCRPHGV